MKQILAAAAAAGGDEGQLGFFAFPLRNVRHLLRPSVHRNHYSTISFIYRIYLFAGANHIGRLGVCCMVYVMHFQIQISMTPTITYY